MNKKKLIIGIGIVLGTPILLYLLFLLVMFCALMISLSDSKWSEEKRQNFSKECSQTETIDDLTLHFYGFANNEFDSVLVKEYRHDVLIDSFNIFVKPAYTDYDKGRWAFIHRTIHINHTFHIIVPKEEPYILTDMKMVMWPQYTMFSEGWGCVMGEYTLDSIRYEHDQSPTIKKREADRNLYDFGEINVKQQNSTGLKL